MEKKNNPYVLCTVALFVFAFILTLTHVFHVNNFMGDVTVAFGYSGVDGEGGAPWAKIILIILNLAGALFLLGYSMNLIPKFTGGKFVPLACAGICLLVVIIAWIVVPGLDEWEAVKELNDDAKVVMSFDGWMLLFTEIAACAAAFFATKNEK